LVDESVSAMDRAGTLVDESAGAMDESVGAMDEGVGAMDAAHALVDDGVSAVERPERFWPPARPARREEPPPPPPATAGERREGRGSTEKPAEPGVSDGDESLLLQPEHILRRVM
jgi:hypothetical protein